MATLLPAQAQTKKNKATAADRATTTTDTRVKSNKPPKVNSLTTTNLPAKDGSTTTDGAATNDAASGQSGSPVALPSGHPAPKPAKNQGRSKQ